jgi:hypothetical protein
LKDAGDDDDGDDDDDVSFRNRRIVSMYDRPIGHTYAD